jgi:peptidoglycan-N-acetylmuramic acid deacetylase
MKKHKALLSIIMVFAILIFVIPQEVYAASLSSKSYGWGYTKSKRHKTPAISKDTKEWLKDYDAYYVYNTKKKAIYLTFDLGYENGYTTKILNVLEEHDIKATFFVCKAFIDKNPKGLKRMVKEGHVVGNHTVNHIPFYKLSESKLKSELKKVETAYKEVTGEDMVKYVRPPEGGYSEKSLGLTQKLGYTSIFWSIALPNDWNLENQPSKETTLSLFKNQHHRGAIVLLHGVSPVVADNLDKMLSQLEEEGYEFKLITDINAEE